METTLDQKLIRLAFDPGATEGEAVNAFLMYRRKFGKMPSLTVEAPKPSRFTSKWEITVGAKKMDGLLYILSHWSKEAFYVIIYEDMRKGLFDSWKIQLAVRFDSQDELDNFNGYFKKAFDLL
jgi:hypothetical protein